MNDELVAALAEAEKALAETESLLAWRELELGERRVNCDFWLAAGSPCCRDLKVQIGRFVALFFSIHECIEKHPRAARNELARELQRLWTRFRAMELRAARPGIIQPGA